jgi:catechol 2,3-dioxygenase-like lactoylglutathione lyase family enzyme
MRQAIECVCVLVRDYDEAIAFYCGTLRFRVAEDTLLGGGKRWVVLSPPGSRGAGILLARAKNRAERAVVGRQAAGRVFLFLRTDDFWRDYRRMRARGVRFNEEPRRETYGTVAVFEDLFGNKWDLIGARRRP